MNSKKTMLLCFIFILSLSGSIIPLYSRQKSPSSSLWIQPGAYHLWKLDETNFTNLISPLNLSDATLSEKAQQTISIAPEWLKNDLEQQFRSLDYYPVFTEPESILSKGDLDGDGIDDLMISSPNGKLDVYLGHATIHQFSLEYHQSIQIPEEYGKRLNPVLIDLDHSGFHDLVFSSENTLYRMKNQKNKLKLTFSSPEKFFQLDPPEEILWSICPFTWNDQQHLILGKEDGTLALISFKPQGWELSDNFFPYWEEQWGSEILRKGVYASQKAQTSVHKLPDESQLLLVTGSKGDLASFHISGNPPIFSSYPLWKDNLVEGSASIAFMDLNADGRTDLLYASSTDPVLYLLNHGTEKHPLWIKQQSQAVNNPLNSFFGGSGYHRDGQILYSRGKHKTEIAHCADFITSLDPLLHDEVLYCIANLQPQDLISYIHQDILHLLVENAQSIHEMAQKLAYVSLVQIEGINTLQYATEEGWKTMPFEIYYPNLVMLNRYLLSPTAVKTLYDGHFFRTFLPEDDLYGTTLYSRVKESKTLYEAAWNVLYWLKVDIGGIWHMGEKPRGWYQIYRNLLNDDVGIWCGEWSIIYEAAARAMNIPCIIIVALGEDHQFNNFWADGWHHADASSGEAGENKSWQEYIGDSLVYYRNWGQRIFSWPMAWEGNGKLDHVKRSELPYNPPDKLSDLVFNVYDRIGKPLDGARIELWSHWPMEGKYQPLPFISAIGYTDGKGKCEINKVGHQNMTVVVVSRIGSVQFYLPLNSTSFNDPLEIILPGKIPELFPGEHLKMPIFDENSGTRTKNIRFESKKDSEARYDDLTGRGYIKIQNFADFINAPWHYNQQTKEIIISKPSYRVSIPYDSVQVRINGKDYSFDHPSSKDFEDEKYLSLKAMSFVYGISLRWNAELHLLELSYRDSIKKTVTIEQKDSKQIHIPWIDIYFTRLQHLEYWKSQNGTLQVWVLKETDINKFLAGEKVDRGDSFIINADNRWTLELPNENASAYYLLVYNPHLCTSVQYDLHFMVQLP